MTNKFSSKPIRIHLHHSQEKPEVYLLYARRGIFTFGNIDQTPDEEIISLYEMRSNDFFVENAGSHLEIHPRHIHYSGFSVDNPELGNSARRLIKSLKNLQGISEG